MNKTIFALIDGNSFYASCQIAFDPSLENRPVVVLSNNDGCIVAANKIAKDLNHELIAKVKTLGNGGYRAALPNNMMFQPFFKVKWLLEKHHAAVFSSNYELYADMSARMHRITGQFAKKQEIYSIDESFLEIDNDFSAEQLFNYGLEIKQQVKQQIGIPVAVGFGYSKTQAKLANHLAKKNSSDNVYDLTNISKYNYQQLMKKVDVSAVWGIGRKLSQRLHSDNITSIYQLLNCDPKQLKQKYGVVLERIVRELNGKNCSELTHIVPAKQQIVSSRSFGNYVTNYKDMEQAIANYTQIAAQKLRQQQSSCRYLTMYIQTNPHKKDSQQYRPKLTQRLVYPSDNSILLIKIAKRLLKQVWQENYLYQKAGVILSEITPKGSLQTDIFAPNPLYSGNQKQDKLMQVMDQTNRKEGKNTLFIGTMGDSKNSRWQMARNLRSPRYTTHWQELKTVS